jgi:threonine dehydrogenase-like Zn-dependent dehydrogenase
MGFEGIIGHEFVGVVIDAPDKHLVGQTVVGEINLSCGNCEFCKEKMRNHCPNRSVLGILGKDGSMAEYLTLPEQNLHVVSKKVSPVKAVFTEPLAAACQIIEQIKITPEQTILVIGDGKLGQLLARVLKLSTDNLIVVGKNHTKLELLKSYDIPTVLLSDFQGKEHSFHLIVEAAGSWDGWNLAQKMVRPGGVIVLKSTYTGQTSFNPASIVINEITVIGSRCGPFKKALSLLETDTVDPSDLITKIYPFEQWRDAFNLASHSSSLKVLIKF